MTPNMNKYQYMNYGWHIAKLHIRAINSWFNIFYSCATTIRTCTMIIILK